MLGFTCSFHEWIDGIPRVSSQHAHLPSLMLSHRTNHWHTKICANRLRFLFSLFHCLKIIKHHHSFSSCVHCFFILCSITVKLWFLREFLPRFSTRFGSLQVDLVSGGFPVGPTGGRWPLGTQDDWVGLKFDQLGKADFVAVCNSPCEVLLFLPKWRILVPRHSWQAGQQRPLDASNFVLQSWFWNKQM